MLKGELSKRLSISGTEDVASPLLQCLKCFQTMELCLTVTTNFPRESKNNKIKQDRIKKKKIKIIYVLNVG